MEPVQPPRRSGPVGVLRVPEHYRDWQGTAEKLAKLVSQELKSTEVADKLNERLVRYYVTLGVLDAPMRRGKEAIFTFHHIVQLMVVRKLLADRFSLGQVRDVLRTIDWKEIDPDSVADLLPRPKASSGNAAEQLVARFKQALPTVSSGIRSSPGFDRLLSARSISRPAEPAVDQPRPALRLHLAPWLELLIDPAGLAGLTEAQAEELGKSLAATLVAQRQRTIGGKSR